MAYLDLSNAFSQIVACPIQAPEDFQPAAVEPANFEHTEWAVIALARTDGLDTLHETPQSWIGRLMFGRPRTYTLAGERLEALRRMAVEAWRRPNTISLPTLGTFISVGFSSAQLALLLSTTGALPVMAKLISASLKIAAPRAGSRNSA